MSFLSRNLGAIDRSLRICGGILLIALASVESIGPWGYLGVVPLITGIAGTCPLYSVFGLNSCARH